MPLDASVIATQKEGAIAGLAQSGKLCIDIIKRQSCHLQ